MKLLNQWIQQSQPSIFDIVYCLVIKVGASEYLLLRLQRTALVSKVISNYCVIVHIITINVQRFIADNSINHPLHISNAVVFAFPQLFGIAI